MYQNALIVIFPAIQFSAIYTALRLCGWQRGSRLFRDSLLFHVATMGAYFIYTPTIVHFGLHQNIQRSAFFLLVGYLTFTVGAVTLWLMQRYREEAIPTVRVSVAAMAATAGFLVPFFGVLLRII
jgi:hypothetical protein